MAGDATLSAIYAAMQTWEQAELVLSGVEEASALKAFTYFPTQADIPTLRYPYTAHGCQVTNFQKVSINNVPSVELEVAHTFWTVLVYGDDNMPPDKKSERDAAWRDAYCEALVKRLQLKAAGVALVAQMTLLSAQPTGFDLFNRPEVGVRFNIQAIARRTLITGL